MHPSGKSTLIPSSLSNKKYVDRLASRKGSSVRCQDEIDGVRDTFSKSLESKVGLIGG